MQFSKLMIEKVYEIRRISPPELKGKIKLSSASLFDELEHYYHDHRAEALSRKIEELFELADLNISVPLPPAQESAEIKVKEQSPDAPKGRRIVYRGQVAYV